MSIEIFHIFTTSAFLIDLIKGQGENTGIHREKTDKKIRCFPPPTLNPYPKNWVSPQYSASNARHCCAAVQNQFPLTANPEIVHLQHAHCFHHTSLDNT